MSIDPTINIKADAAEWAGILKQATQSLKQVGGHQHIYLHASGEVGITYPITSPKNAGRETSPALITTFKQIVEITGRFLKDCNSYLQADMRSSLRSLAERQLKEVNVDSSSLAVAQEILLIPVMGKRKSTPLPAEVSAEVNFVMRNAAIVNRSENGKDGVYFIDSVMDDKSIRTVVKLVTNPHIQLTGDKLFQLIGVIVPNSYALDKNSKEAALIKEKLSELIDDEDVKEEFVKNLELSDHFMYTEFIEGCSFGSLPALNRVQLANPQFMKQLGKVILIDVLCGNKDRLAPKTFNPHNIMVAAGKPVCIDNLYIYYHEETSSKKQLLTALLSGEETDPKIIKDLFKRLITEPNKFLAGSSIKETFSDVDFARYNYPDRCRDKSDTQLRQEIVIASKDNREADFITPAVKEARSAMREGIRDAAREILLLSRQTGVMDFLPEEVRDEFAEMMSIINEMEETQ